MLNLRSPVGTNYRVDPNDVMDTKRALSDLGYYDVPPHRGIDDWTDDAMFDGIKRFQKDKGLKVDGFMHPGGVTEQKVNMQLVDAAAGNGGATGDRNGSQDDLPLRTGPFTIPPQPPLPPIRMPSPYDKLPKPIRVPSSQPPQMPVRDRGSWPMGTRG